MSLAAQRRAPARRGSRVRVWSAAGALVALLLGAGLPAAGRLGAQSRPAAARPALEAKLPDWLHEVVGRALQEERRRLHAVGLSAALIRDGRIVYAGGAGLADRERRIPAGPDTLYRWASVSQPVTAVAVLRLAERGRIDLDADVRLLVPEFPKKRWPVTARQLLAHLGGIVASPNDAGIRTKRGRGGIPPSHDVVTALDTFKDFPLIAEPGTRYSDSPLGYILLGALVQKAAGQPYWDYVRDEIARPAGMASFRPGYQWEEIPGRAKGYRLRKDGRIVPSTDTGVSWKLPGGGFLSNVVDLARFGRAVLARRWLSPKTWRAALAPQRTKAGEQVPYGLGFALGRWRGFVSAGNGGTDEKVRTRLTLVPALGIGVALMCNTEGVRLARTAERLLDLIEPDGLRASVERLAAPDWRGRAFGTPGGAAAAGWIARRFAACGLEPGFGDSWFHEFEHGGRRGRNVAGLLAPKGARGLILVAAHYDHLGRARAGGYYPGADDNASGVAVLLALARRLAARRGELRSRILFVSFDAEEEGLLGSKAAVAAGALPLDELKAVLVFDLVGGNFLPWRTGEIYVMGAEHSPELAQSLAAVSPPPGLSLRPLGTWILEPLGPAFARSDYGPFRDRGVPYLFMSSATPWYYHTQADRPAHLDYAKMRRLTRYCTDLLVRLAAEPKPSFSAAAAVRRSDVATLLEAVEDLLAHRDAMRLGRSLAVGLERTAAHLKDAAAADPPPAKAKRLVQRALALMLRAVATAGPPRRR